MPSTMLAREMPFSTFLVTHGYEIAFRRDGFVEVLASRGHERFHGRGVSDDDALADLMRSMFPSVASRALLEAALAATRISTVVAEAPAAAAIETKEPEPAPAQEASATAEPAAPEPAVASPEETTPVEQPPIVARSAASPPASAPAVDEVAESVAVCEDILAEIDERLDELSRIAPESQRLLMLSFICRARAEVEEVPASEVHQATARIAKRLSDLAKVLWPGSVRALQLGVMPFDALPRSRGVSAPESWDEAADAVELLIADRRHADHRAGRDADGYDDADCLTPPPRDVTKLVGEVIRALETLGTRFDVTLAERTAAQVRWLRRSVQGRQWGPMMGKLRQMSLKLGSEGTTLRDYLDPAFAPRSSWRDVVDPPRRSSVVPADDANHQAPRPLVDVTVLRAELPTLDAPDVDERLAGWLPKAVIAFETSVLTEQLAPYRAVLARIMDAVAFDDRRGRRRFRDVLTALSLSTVAAPEDSSAEGESVDDAEQDDVDVAGAEFDALVDAVRRRTAGRTAMFVSNREDPDLARKLSELLGLTLLWVESTPRRVEAACEKIVRRPPDFVLSATGFQLHSVDASLAKAARAGGVPFVRVNRGRPVACVLALARELGIGRSARSREIERESA